MDIKMDGWMDIKKQMDIWKDRKNRRIVGWI